VTNIIDITQLTDKARMKQLSQLGYDNVELALRQFTAANWSLVGKLGVAAIEELRAQTSPEYLPLIRADLDGKRIDPSASFGAELTILSDNLTTRTTLTVEPLPRQYWLLYIFGGGQVTAFNAVAVAGKVTEFLEKSPVDLLHLLTPAVTGMLKWLDTQKHPTVAIVGDIKIVDTPELAYLEIMITQGDAGVTIKLDRRAMAQDAAEVNRHREDIAPT
jgi:hypothetical protein